LEQRERALKYKHYHGHYQPRCQNKTIQVHIQVMSFGLALIKANVNWWHCWSVLFMFLQNYVAPFYIRTDKLVVTICTMYALI
jgi:hypothetical protein